LNDGSGSGCAGGFSALSVENIWVNAPGPLLAGAAAEGAAGFGASGCAAGFSALSVENICVNAPGPGAEPLGAAGTAADGSGTGGPGTFVTSACPSDFADSVLNICVKLPC
jgi:hypothetical protein